MQGIDDAPGRQTMLSTDTKPHEAINAATLAADASWLPQTVYRGPDSGGWWHTQAMAGMLMRPSISVLVTILPRNYFN